MDAIAGLPQTATEFLRPQQRSPLWLFAVTLLTSLAALTVAGSAWASYPGRSGSIAFEQYAGSLDANGVQTDEYSLGLVSPSARSIATRLDCQSVMGDFGGSGQQFCPLFGSGGVGPSYSPDGGVSYSPTGQSLVVAGAMYQANGERTPAPGGCRSCEAIILADADGSSPRLVPVSIADAEQPAFMPHHNTLIFAGRMSAHSPVNLYTVASDGTKLTPVTGNGASQTAPCANGSVVYVHDGDLYLRDAAGATRRLTRHGGTTPDCSHDSRTIAFVRGGALYTVYATGDDLRRLTPPHMVDGRPAFSPSGGLIAFTSTTTTATPSGCYSDGEGDVVLRLEMIDLRGHQRRRYTAASQACAEGGPLTLGSTAWQPLPPTTS